MNIQAVALRFGLCALLAVPLPGTAPASETDTRDLRPFTARYKAMYHGVKGGMLEFSLSKGDRPGSYVYSSKAEPTLLGRILVSPKARESSQLTVDENGVRPQRYLFDDGSSSEAGDTQLNFDWSTSKLSGRAEGQPMDLQLEPRTQERLSVQIAVIVDFLQQRAPGVYPLIDDTELKHYEYRREGTERIKSALGEFDTVVMYSTKVGGSRRSNRYWHAAELGYLPIRAERLNKGDVDLVLELQEVRFE